MNEEFLGLLDKVADLHRCIEDGSLEFDAVVKLDALVESVNALSREGTECMRLLGPGKMEGEEHAELKSRINELMSFMLIAMMRALEGGMRDGRLTKGGDFDAMFDGMRDLELMRRGARQGRAFEAVAMLAFSAGYAVGRRDPVNGG